MKGDDVADPTLTLCAHFTNSTVLWQTGLAATACKQMAAVLVTQPQTDVLFWIDAGGAVTVCKGRVNDQVAGK